ncbi:hypothetical protein NKJ48_14210 [Mesorhizobium sp. M0114]|uniref:hypothetical protein n=1 Tax=unclassified Mesorhizobium TaxID=325217 RepID=UPI0033377330
MGDQAKAALIIAAAILIATAMYIYFSPYQSCVRAGEGRSTAPYLCAQGRN